MTTVVNIFVPGTYRTAGTWPVAQHLRPVRPIHWRPGFVPVFQRLAEPIERPFWRNYDLIETMPLDEAMAWPICGEA